MQVNKPHHSDGGRWDRRSGRDRRYSAERRDATDLYGTRHNGTQHIPTFSAIQPTSQAPTWLHTSASADAFNGGHGHETETALPTPPQGQRSDQRRDVLVAEDDAALREIIRTLLTDAGFTVDEATDGEAALAHLRAKRYRLLLLDLVMPRTSGFEVLQALHLEPSLRPPAILVLSGLHEQATVMRALEAGADDYLTKPFPINEFVLRVSLWLRRAGPATEAAAPATPPGLRIHSLGRFFVEHGGQIRLHDGRRARKAGTLFKYVLSRSQRPVPTAEILALLWPQSPEDVATSDLRSLLYSLRRLLGYPTGAPSCLVHAGATLTLGLGTHDWWDVAEFTTLLARGAHWQRVGDMDQALAAYTAGVALYGGDFLAADAYADWARPCREYLRGQWLRALSAIALLHSERGEHQEQELALRTLLNADPYHEPSYRALMALLVRHGRSAEALVLYRHLERLLRVEFGANPDPETQALVSRMG